MSVMCTYSLYQAICPVMFIESDTKGFFFFFFFLAILLVSKKSLLEAVMWSFYQLSTFISPPTLTSLHMSCLLCILHCCLLFFYFSFRNSLIKLYYNALSLFLQRCLFIYSLLALYEFSDWDMTQI